MRAVLLRSFVFLAILAFALPSFAQITEERKIEVNKIIHMIGFTPNFNSSAVVGETEPNDDCTGPDGADLFADSVSGAIDAGGDEDWFAFTANEGDCFTFATDSFNASDTDTQLYIYEAATCTDPFADLEFNDDGGPGLFSLISDWPAPAAGTYYLRVKHFSATGTGEYELFSSVGACPAPPANNTCANAEPLACNSAVSGTTAVATNDLEDLPSPEVCIPFGADGPDVFYEITVPAGNQLTAVLTPDNWDPGIWFVKDCTDRNTCV
ncbi:MAG: hypothetical protein HKO57_17150, partial [Akkermansiaceae bacterium]|nr:hypothetical protein [Akkermansiaceae bacterium]